MNEITVIAFNQTFLFPTMKMAAVWLQDFDEVKRGMDESDNDVERIRATVDRAYVLRFEYGQRWFPVQVGRWCEEQHSVIAEAERAEDARRFKKRKVLPDGVSDVRLSGSAEQIAGSIVDIVGDNPGTSFKIMAIESIECDCDNCTKMS